MLTYFRNKLLTYFQFILYIFTLDDIERSTQGNWVNEACYDYRLLETHIGSHIWSLSLPQEFWNN